MLAAAAAVVVELLAAVEEVPEGLVPSGVMPLAMGVAVAVAAMGIFRVVRAVPAS